MRRARLVLLFLLVTASCSQGVTVRASSPVGDSLPEPDAPTTTTTVPPVVDVPPEPAQIVVEPVPVVVAVVPAPAPVRAPTAAVAPVAACSGWADAVAEAFGDAAPAACRVLACESHGDPGALNRSGASGLFQEMAVHAWRYTARGWDWLTDRFDGLRNIAVAAEIFFEQGWRPWACRP